MQEPVATRVSTASHVGTIAKYNFLNYFRARRFYVILAIVAAITALLTAAIAYYRPELILSTDLGFYSATWGNFVTLVVILSTAFFGGDAISGEFQNRTGYFLVPNPIRRSAIYVGKWLAALAASTIILGLFALAILFNGIYYFPGVIPWQFEQSVAFAWLYLVAALSLAFAFSSLFKSSAISIMMSVILLLIVFGIVDLVAGTVAGVEPWFSITYGSGIISNILAPTYPAHIQNITAPTGPGRFLRIINYNATVPEGILILMAYLIVTAVVGLWLFERKEFTS